MHIYVLAAPPSQPSVPMNLCCQETRKLPTRMEEGRMTRVRREHLRRRAKKRGRKGS